MRRVWLGISAQSRAVGCAYERRLDFCGYPRGIEPRIVVNVPVNDEWIPIVTGSLHRDGVLFAHKNIKEQYEAKSICF